MSLLPRILGAFIALLIPLFPVSAQTQEELASLEPKDLFFNGWKLARDADRLLEQEQFIDAYDKLRQAKVMFDTIAINHPTYEPNLVLNRQKMTRGSMEATFPKAKAEQAARAEKSGGFIEENRPTPLAPLNPSLELKLTNNLQELQRQITQLKSSLAGALNDRDAEAAKKRKAIQNLEAERNRMAAAPLKSEMDALNEEIARLKSERQTMSMARSKTRRELEKTKLKLDVSQKAYAASQRKVRELMAVVEEQRNINNRVVQGQQEQIDQLRREMRQKDQLMLESNKQLQDLSKQLEQSYGMISDLQKERDQAIQERDNMAELLDLSQSDQLQKLLAQNVSLHQKYKEANLKLDTMLKSADATKEDIKIARQGIVVAKAKLREAERENARQNLRVDDLEKRLKMAEGDLIATAENEDLSPAQRREIELLRILAKEKRDQLQAQKKKGELLIAQAERMGMKDPLWADAVKQFQGALEITMTAEEEAIFNSADFTVKSRFQPDSSERIRANRELQRRTGDLKNVATRLFEKNDLPASRGILEMVIEEDPGAWDAMINLGIVNLRESNPSEAAKQFQQAILYAGDRKIPLAHFYLGDSLYRTEIYEDAQRELNLSLSMSPENAQAHILLGNMAGKTGDLLEAEDHFKEASQIDPKLWEPHYNLAFLYSLSGRASQGKIFYQEALRRGAPANLQLEKKLGL